MPALKDFSKDIEEKLRKLDSELDILFNNAGLTMRKETRKLMKDSNSYATRRLSNNTNFDYKKTKGNRIITFGSNAKQDGFAYGAVYEFGRKKGKGISKAGQENFVKYLKKKIMLGHFDKIDVGRKSKRGRLGTKERRENILKGIAFLFSQKVKKHGMEGKFFYQKGFLAGNKYINDNINNLIVGVFA